ncbi:hypothetical protein FMUND_2861 [Fusarium mundagurra]|uniref:Apple domain-containing protein n=1 Tax=Fusarium mundagurra TaxID=1567541 RepID=A0A8H5Z158_9HYPO|nr:hypothetical protein FMUND_2861 [Fusarium mundagurra]
MARHFVRSFVIAAALSPFVHAGPCRPSSSSVVVVTSTAETSVATGSATTHTKESSLTESLSGTSAETSVTISESGSSTGTSTETTLATSKTESGSTTAEQSTTTGSALSTDITTSASESGSSTDTTLAATTTTGCPEPEPPVYDDPFTHTDTEVVPATTSEAATTTEDAAATIIPRNFIRRGHPEIFVRDATSEAVPVNSEDPTTTTGEATTTTAEATSTTEDATTTTGEATTSGEDTTTGETTATSQDTTATTEAPTTTTEEATTTTEETTTASETATGCVNNMERPTPEGAICGTRGYIQGTSNDWRYLSEGVSSSLMECYASCQKKSNCVTFFYEKDVQCTLYMGTITQLSPNPNGAKSYQTRCFCDTGIDPAPTCSYADPFSNGGFEDGTLSPWVEDPNPGGYDPVYSKVVPGGEGGSSYHFQTGQFDADKSLWLYQDIKACPGTRFTCTYNWWWNEYYEIEQDDGSSLVPYVRVYQGDTNVVGNRWPTSEAQTKTWVPAQFTFTMPSNGKTRIWFIASSPQGEWINTSDDPCNPNWVHRPNWFALDSIACRAR